MTWDSGLTRRDRAAPAHGELQLICQGGSRADPARCALQGMRSGWGGTFLQRDVVVAASWLVRKLGCGQRRGWCRSWGSSGDLVGEAAAACSDRHRGSCAVRVGVAAAACSDQRRGSRVVRIGVAAAACSDQHQGSRMVRIGAAAARRFWRGTTGRTVHGPPRSSWHPSSGPPEQSHPCRARGQPAGRRRDPHGVQSGASGD